AGGGPRPPPAVTAAFAGMADAFAALREEDHEVLAINAAISLGSVWLSGRIGRFQMRFPDLAVRLSLANEAIDLANSSFDVAIRAGSGVWEGLRSTFLFRQHFSPICTREFLEANAISKPEDLLRVERLAPNDAGWSGWFSAAGVEAKLAPRRGIVMDNQSQEASIVQESYGVALMSPLFWRTELESGRLIQPFDTLYMPGTAHWLVHPAHRVGVRKIERLREWLLEELEGYRDVMPAEVFTPL
ncbi:LysR substrate-binding domain-containing protein, partial [Novosphingobium sp. KN65.2]|uniref:LysR substrate-binding domain-containing protein n=1 Tax=Novosphingobium sp. KN65.2 TaxID=1478134 RepID=UPI0006D5B44F